MKKVSVIIPAYKTADYIKDCVESVMRQTHTNLEIIIVDDGSPDNLYKIAEEYEKLDTRVQLVRQKNEGLSGARNAGLKIATGEFVIFLDSDDLLQKDAIERLLHVQKTTQADFVTPDRFTEVSLAGEEKIQLYFTAAEQYTKPADFVVNILIRQAKGWGATARLYKTSIIKQYNIHFPKDYTAEDVIFNFKYLSKIHSFALLKYPAMTVNRRKGSITHGYRKDLLKVFLFVDKMASRYLNNVNYNKEKGQIALDSLLCRNIILWINSEMSGRNKEKWIRKVGRIYGVLQTKRVKKAFQQKKYLKPYWNERRKINYVVWMRFLIKHQLYPLAILSAMYSNKTGLFE